MIFRKQPTQPSSVSSLDAMMARHEEDREDLIREAVAYPNRIEWQVPGESEPVVTGIRSDQRLSVFFGQDPVFHFNPDGQLRRAFVDGFLYRTQGGTLAKLHRERSEAETTLVRNDLDERSLCEFLSSMTARIMALRDTLKSCSAEILRSVSEGDAEADFVGLLSRVLAANPQLAPAIATRRE